MMPFSVYIKRSNSLGSSNKHQSVFPTRGRERTCKLRNIAMSYYRQNEEYYERPPCVSMNGSYGDECGYDQPQMMRVRPSNEEPYQSYGYPQSQPNLPSQGQLVKVSCKANPEYALGIRDGRVIMVYCNPSDPTQQWVKDEKWSSRVRDQVGHPAFTLVNKATGQALRHAPAPYQEVGLSPHDVECMDEKVLWSESEDMGYGYRTIRSASDINMNLDAFKGDASYGGIREGTHCVMWTWNKHDNQLWKLSPCYPY